jgi:hypothetical protein
MRIGVGKNATNYSYFVTSLATYYRPNVATSLNLLLWILIKLDEEIRFFSFSMTRLL